jgi:putative MATE family efflux protein
MGEDLTEGGVVKTIVKTSIPLMIAFLLQSAFNVVDAFFVGRIGAEELAAVSISFPIVFLIISIGSGIGVGTTSVVARFIGAKKYRKADNVAEHALLIALITGVILSFTGLLMAPMLFDWIGAGGNLKSLALDYIDVLLCFSTFILLAMVGNSILRGEGDMKTPMIVMGMSAILNIILDPVFIFDSPTLNNLLASIPLFDSIAPNLNIGLGLGVRGAAIATIISRSFGFLFMMYYILSGKSWITLDFRNFMYNLGFIRKILSVGVPSALSNITMSAGMFLLTVIVGLFGIDALAAYGIGFRLDAIAVLPSMGVSIAVISIVGQSLGAGKIDRAKSVTLKAGIMSSVFMTLIGLLFYVFAPQIISIFNSEPGVVEHGISFLRIIPLSYIVVGIAICISSAFIGSGKAILALLVTILRVVIFSVPAAYLLSRSYGVPGIWWGIVLGSFLGFAVSMLLFKFSSWERTQLYD